MKTIKSDKIEIAEVGFYLKLVKEEYPNRTNEEYTDLISEEFNIICTMEDIERYEMLHVDTEDYEKLSRMTKYNVEQLIE